MLPNRRAHRMSTRSVSERRMQKFQYGASLVAGPAKMLHVFHESGGRTWARTKDPLIKSQHTALALRYFQFPLNPETVALRAT